MFGTASAAKNMTSTTVEAIDPCNRTGKISIPITRLEETRGIQLWREEVLAAKRANASGKSSSQVKPMDLSLCLLFQKGRCNAGARCNQVHADPSFVEELRAKAATASNCCAAHGDIHSEGMENSSMRITVTDDSTPAGGKCYLLSSFGRTKALEYFMRQASRDKNTTEIAIPAMKLCRLHAQNRCKFGRDCKNVHLCSKATPVSPRKVEEPVTTTTTPKLKDNTPPAQALPSMNRFESLEPASRTPIRPTSTSVMQTPPATTAKPQVNSPPPLTSFVPTDAGTNASSAGSVTDGSSAHATTTTPPSRRDSPLSNSLEGAATLASDHLQTGAASTNATPPTTVKAAPCSNGNPLVAWDLEASGSQNAHNTNNSLWGTFNASNSTSALSRCQVSMRNDFADSLTLSCGELSDLEAFVADLTACSPQTFASPAWK